MGSSDSDCCSSEVGVEGVLRRNEQFRMIPSLLMLVSPRFPWEAAVEAVLGRIRNAGSEHQGFALKVICGAVTF